MLSCVAFSMMGYEHVMLKAAEVGSWNERDGLLNADDSYNVTLFDSDVNAGHWERQVSQLE